MPAEPGDPDPLANSDWNRHFRTDKHLKSGAYGCVWRCDDLASNEKVAIKFISRARNRIDRNVEREIINHSMLEHPHIIQFRLCFLTDKYLAIAMEYADGDNLLSLVNDRQGLSEDDARWLFQQLMLAVDYAHRMGVVNRDIKLENIMLKSRDWQPILKVCDFGYSINENHSLPKTAVGTPGYTAPEVLGNVRDMGYSGKAADVWSSGVVLFAMLFCRYPFQARPGDPPNTRKYQQARQKLFIERIQAGDVVLPADKPVSLACQDLISRIFNPLPDKRITIPEILQHPWFMINLPTEMLFDWNRQIIHHVNSRQRAEDIRGTVQAALMAGCPKPYFCDSAGSFSGDTSDMEGANY